MLLIGSPSKSPKRSSSAKKSASNDPPAPAPEPSPESLLPVPGSDQWTYVDQPLYDNVSLLVIITLCCCKYSLAMCEQTRMCLAGGWWHSSQFLGRDSDFLCGQLQGCVPICAYGKRDNYSLLLQSQVLIVRLIIMCS